MHVQQGKVLRQLAVQEFGGVFAFHADHAQVGQGGNSVREAGSWRGLSCPVLFIQAAGLCAFTGMGVCFIDAPWRRRCRMVVAPSRWRQAPSRWSWRLSPAPPRAAWPVHVVAAGARPMRSCSTPGFACLGQDRRIKAGNYEIPGRHHATQLAAQAGARRGNLADLDSGGGLDLPAGAPGAGARKTRSSKTHAS